VNVAKAEKIIEIVYG